MPKAGARRRKKHTHVHDGPNPLQTERSQRVHKQDVSTKNGKESGKKQRDVSLATSGRLPRSMVIRRGKHTTHLKDLQADLRKVSDVTRTKDKEMNSKFVLIFVQCYYTRLIFIKQTLMMKRVKLNV